MIFRASWRGAGEAWGFGGEVTRKERRHQLPTWLVLNHNFEFENLKNMKNIANFRFKI